MAEDDDDWAFGDFTSASSQSNSQHNGPKSFKEDDEWGDFVISPQQSKPSDPSSNGYHQSDRSTSPSPLANRGGALPLSIFGDADEEVGNLGISGDVDEGKDSGIAGNLNSNFAHNKVSNDRNFSIADLYNQYPEIKPENGHGSISVGSVDLVGNGLHLSSNQNGAGSAFTEMKNRDTVVVEIDGSEPTNKIDNDEFNFQSDPSKKDDLFGGWPQEFMGFSPNLSMQQSSSDLHMNGPNQEMNGSDTAIENDDDDDDDGWEFKDAYSGLEKEEVNNNNKVDLMANQVSEKSVYSSGVASGSNNALDLFGTPNGSFSFSPMSNVSVDYFATSNGISGPSGTSQEVGFIGIEPSIANANGFTSETSSAIEQINNKGPSNHSTDVGSAEFDDSFTEFTSASAVAVPKPGESTNGFVFPSTYADTVSTLDGKTQVKEKDTNLDLHKGAIPLSIFGDENPESGDSSDAQDVLMRKSTAEQRNSYTPKTVISINDLISSLYSQAEPTNSTNTVQKPTETQLSPSDAVSTSGIVNGDELDDDSWDFKDADDLDDGSWEFKDASQMIVDSESTIISTGDTNLSSKLKLNSYLDFYSTLKEELCFVTKSHIENLKQAQGTAALSGEDAGAASIDGEFQLACKELEQMNFLFEDSTLHDHPSGDINQFVQVLLEPQFQILESEYHLSQKLLLVKKDLSLAMELLRHTTTMIKILTITPEEQRVYISVWIEMISACAQELRHGASIWNQAVKKHLQSQLLSETQGRKFFLALGEIYRVVVVLGASAKLFKPWTLSGSVDNPAIYSLLEECHALWSSSGLEEALSSVSAPTALDSTSLFKSIKHILGLDALILQNYVFAETETRCWFSILTAGVVPGMKMITWRNEQCFVTLANLWANLISQNPPELPQLNLG